MVHAEIDLQKSIGIWYFSKIVFAPEKGHIEYLKSWSILNCVEILVMESYPHSPPQMERVVALLVNNFKTNQIKIEKHMDHHYQQHLLFVESDQDWKTYGSSSSTICSVGLWSVHVWTYTEPFGPGQNNCICTQRQQSVVCITKGAIESKCDFFICVESQPLTSEWSLDNNRYWPAMSRQETHPLSHQQELLSTRKNVQIKICFWHKI